MEEEEEEDQWQQRRARFARERARGSECVARAADRGDLQAAVSGNAPPQRRGFANLAS